LKSVREKSLMFAPRYDSHEGVDGIWWSPLTQTTYTSTAKLVVIAKTSGSFVVIALGKKDNISM
jgi:hypothetical protein